ncbi:MAG: hypothetical protein GDA55_05040 [Cellvibrionales bacterium]|nr:hypothetical protein [Cellvibrionales bacterium]
MKIRNLALLATVALALAACASNRYQIETPISQRFSTFDALEIADIKTNVKTDGATQMAAALPALLIDKIASHNESNPAKPIFAQVTAAGGGGQQQ